MGPVDVQLEVVKNLAGHDLLWMWCRKMGIFKAAVLTFEVGELETIFTFLLNHIARKVPLSTVTVMSTNHDSFKTSIFEQLIKQRGLHHLICSDTLIDFQEIQVFRPFRVRTLLLEFRQFFGYNFVWIWCLGTDMFRIVCLDRYSSPVLRKPLEHTIAYLDCPVVVQGSSPFFTTLIRKRLMERGHSLQEIVVEIPQFVIRYHAAEEQCKSYVRQFGPVKPEE